MANIFYMINGLTFREGQDLTANWGACYPVAKGKITGFEHRPANMFHPADVLAVIEWEDGTHSKEELNRIHEPGWRSANGSPIGIFTV